MTAQTTQIVTDNDRIYQGLAHLHRQEHLKDGCMCTTEISGVYKVVLDEVNKLINLEVWSVLEDVKLSTNIPAEVLESIKNRYKL